MNKKVFFALLALTSSTIISCSNSNSVTSNSSVTSIEESSLNSSFSASINSSSEEQSSSKTNNGNTSRSNNGNNSKSSSEKITSIESSATPSSYKYSLEEWTTFAFYEGTKGKHNEDWTYYYGSSKNPNGVLYNSPDAKGNGSGVHFEKYTQYMESPTFKSWKKIEIRFQLWFSSKTSKTYAAKENEPQILLEHRNGESVLGKTEINLERSDVPNNSTCYELKTYIRENKMDNFVFKFNNTIPNGNSGYTIVVHEISLKGWDYE